MINSSNQNQNAQGDFFSNAQDQKKFFEEENIPEILNADLGDDPKDINDFIFSKIEKSNSDSIKKTLNKDYQDVCSSVSKKERVFYNEEDGDPQPIDDWTDQDPIHYGADLIAQNKGTTVENELPDGMTVRDIN